MKRMLAVLAVALTGAALATTEPVATAAASPANEAGRAMPVERKVAGVDVLSGGVGVAEAAYMKSRMAEYPLAIVFSARSGEYAVPDRVTLTQRERRVVAVDAAGPYLMVRVPPGRYTVAADFAGAVETRQVSVGDSHAHVAWVTPHAR